MFAGLGDLSMLLLITNSLDGSSDYLMHLCRAADIGAFRLNADLFPAYKFDWSSRGFAIVDPTGRTATSENVSCCYWRKPSFDGTLTVPGDECERAWAKAQCQYIVRELANWCRDRGLLRLVEPNAEFRFGKIAQMLLAAQYMSVPQWNVTCGIPLAAGQRIVKTLSAEMLDNQTRFLFSTPANPSELNPCYPWFLQEEASGDVDATVVFIAGKCVGFKLRRLRPSSHHDWRVLIGDPSCQWDSWELSSTLTEAIQKFMRAAHLHYGRLDFIVGPDQPVFLEVNPNGQFGWLDDSDLTLHRLVLNALFDSGTTIKADYTR